MGNQNEAEVRRVLDAATARPSQTLPDRRRRVPQVYKTALKALEVFQQDYRTFYPYSSKYDAV